MSTFANPAYDNGTHVRCDVCRDPYALVEPRPGSELILLPDPGGLVGRDAAEAQAIREAGFVRQGDGELWCAGCAKNAPASR